MPVGQLLRLGTGGAGTSYSAKVLSHSPIAYWPLWEASGGVAECLVDSAQNGAYTGVTLGQTGIGDGNTYPLFDGTNDFANIYSTTFRDAFDGNEGTLAIWVRAINAALWTDGAHHVPLMLKYTGSNFMQLRKNTADAFAWSRVALGDWDSRTGDPAAWGTGWIHLAITWSKSADNVIAYKDAVREGDIIDYGKDFSGQLAATTTVIAASATDPLTPWHGWLAHFVVFDTPLTPAQIADLAVV